MLVLEKNVKNIIVYEQIELKKVLMQICLVFENEKSLKFNLSLKLILSALIKKGC